MFPIHLKHARRRRIFFYFCNVTYNPLKNFPWFHDFSRSDPHTGFQDFPGFFQVFPGFFTFSMTNFRHSMTFENHWNSIPFPYLFPGQTKFHTDSILFWNSMTSSHPVYLCTWIRLNSQWEVKSLAKSVKHIDTWYLR